MRPGVKAATREVGCQASQARPGSPWLAMTVLSMHPSHASAGRTDHPCQRQLDQLCGFFRACHSYTCIGASVTDAIPAAIAFRIKAVITPGWHSPFARFLRNSCVRAHRPTPRRRVQ